MLYGGPQSKVLRKLKTTTASSFTVDGLPSHEEERGIFVKQTFSLKQYEDRAVDNLEAMSRQWTFEEEKAEFEHHDADGVLLPTPFTQTHTISDRLLLNKTFKQVYFNPDNAHNFLKVDNVASAQLAPLLCSKRQFENTTVAPKVTGISAYDIQETVLVPLAMYGFG